MALEEDFDDLDTDRVGGYDRVQPGDYHMLIENIDEEGEDFKIVVTCQVLTGTTMGQAGKQYTIKIKKDSGDLPKRQRIALAIAIGCYTLDDVKKAKQEKRGLSADYSRGVGRSICVCLENSQDGKYTNLRFDSIWRPDDKRAAHIPLHPKAIERDGITLPADRPIEGVTAASAKQRAAAAGGAKSKEKPKTTAEDAVDGLDLAL